MEATIGIVRIFDKRNLEYWDEKVKIGIERKIYNFVYLEIFTTLKKKRKKKRNLQFVHSFWMQYFASYRNPIRQMAQQKSRFITAPKQACCS